MLLRYLKFIGQGTDKGVERGDLPLGKEIRSRKRLGKEQSLVLLFTFKNHAHVLWRSKF